MGKRPWKLILDPGPCGGNALEILQKFPRPWRKFLQWKRSLRAPIGGLFHTPVTQLKMPTLIHKREINCGC